MATGKLPGMENSCFNSCNKFTSGRLGLAWSNLNLKKMGFTAVTGTH